MIRFLLALFLAAFSLNAASAGNVRQVDSFRLLDIAKKHGQQETIKLAQVGQIATAPNKQPAPSASYSGPGDQTTFLIWGSVARVYNLAKASTSTSMADLVAVTGGAAVCTLRGSATGSVDLAASYCAGTTPALACAAASGGSCKVTKLYDQVGANNWVQLTLAKMPTLAFNAVNGLPTMGFSFLSGTEMVTGSPVSQSQPYTWEVIADQTISTNGDGVVLSSNGNVIEYPFNGGSVGNIFIYGGVGTLTSAISITNYHVVQGVFNGASSQILIDGSTVNSPPDIGGVAMSGAVTLGSAGGSAAFDGNISEVGPYAGTANTNVQSNARTAYGL